MTQAVKRTFLKSVGLLVLSAILPGSAFARAEESPYRHLVILGDLHLPGSNMAVKTQVLETINTWSDVEMVVAVGDLCEEYGTDAEYGVVREFFSKLGKPLAPIVGNHDFIYSWFRKGTKSVRADAEIRAEKLRSFRETFGLNALYYRKIVGGYSLIFLSTDSPGHLAELSETQLAWLRAELERNARQPTIIFFHAPLEGTLRNYNKNANAPNFIAQPSQTIHALLKDNPQVFLWVSGHTHTTPREESFASALNVYDQRVTNIHNSDMQDRETVWTNSLFLHPDKVVVKTYDHGKGAWLPELEREIKTPMELAAAA